MKVPYNREINKKNLATFAKYGIKNDPGTPIYNCVLCEQPTTMADSWSHEGNKLLCDYCFSCRMEGTMKDTKKWQEEEDQ